MVVSGKYTLCLNTDNSAMLLLALGPGAAFTPVVDAGGWHSEPLKKCSTLTLAGGKYAVKVRQTNPPQPPRVRFRQNQAPAASAPWRCARARAGRSKTLTWPIESAVFRGAALCGPGGQRSPRG